MQRVEDAVLRGVRLCSRFLEKRRVIAAARRELATKRRSPRCQSSCSRLELSTGQGSPSKIIDSPSGKFATFLAKRWAATIKPYYFNNLLLFFQ
tara:strand:+ start:275 stop:556 length:282 start_codon:yes stop_codon:yes gene_type:complete